MAFPESFLQDLKMRNDITDVVSGYVNLKRRGRNMVGLCPFHGEKTPSFNVYTENGSFYCFGCGVGGDVISFIMKIENLDYVDAVKYLAQRAGLEMPENSYDDSMSRLRNRVFEANREAARFIMPLCVLRKAEKVLIIFIQEPYPTEQSVISDSVMPMITGRHYAIISNQKALMTANLLPQILRFGTETATESMTDSQTVLCFRLLI